MVVQLTPDRPRYFGVVHLPPLPGTPYWLPAGWEASIADVAEQADTLRRGGLDGVLLQSGDRVYPTGDVAEPGRVVGLTRYAIAVREASPDDFAVGVQLLRHGVSASLATARLTGLDFVRVDALIGATLTTHGWVEPDALTIMRRRRELDAEMITMICDIDSTHFRWAGGELPIAALALKAMLVGADAVAVDRTGLDEQRSAIDEISKASPVTPIFVGGHLSSSTVRDRASGTCGGFVRSCLIDESGRIDLGRVHRFVAASRS